MSVIFDGGPDPPSRLCQLLSAIADPPSTICQGLSVNGRCNPSSPLCHQSQHSDDSPFHCIFLHLAKPSLVTNCTLTFNIKSPKNFNKNNEIYQLSINVTICVFYWHMQPPLPLVSDCQQLPEPHSPQCQTFSVFVYPLCWRWSAFA